MTIRPACAMNAEKLPTLPPTTMSPPLSEMPQRKDASPSTIEQTAMRRRAGGRRCEPLDVDAARHHVLGRARARVAVHGDRGVFVHARHVVAHVPVNVDIEIGIESAGDGMRAVGISARESATRPPRPRACAGTDSDRAAHLVRQIELARRRRPGSNSP